MGVQEVDPPRLGRQVSPWKTGPARVMGRGMVSPAAFPVTHALGKTDHGAAVPDLPLPWVRWLQISHWRPGLSPQSTRWRVFRKV